jgi:hypothetical protein
LICYKAIREIRSIRVYLCLPIRAPGRGVQAGAIQGGGFRLSKTYYFFKENISCSASASDSKTCRNCRPKLPEILPLVRKSVSLVPG